MKIPPYVARWFCEKGWKLHPYQRKMFTLFKQKKSTLLIAPTGGGKTLASFLPVISSIQESKSKGLHTLYISPLKALVNDIERNLKAPINEMNLNISVDVRTGDTSAYRRQKQRKKPSPILLTTPESLLLLLSYKDAKDYFASLQTVIIDELHTLCATKRGDLLALCLSQLRAYASGVHYIGLSATVAQPDILALWLGREDSPAELLVAKSQKSPQIHLLPTKKPIPYSGFMAKYAIDAVYEVIHKHQLTVLFVNTRAQAEFIFQELWQKNTHNLPIALYHGSLSKEQRTKTEQLILANALRAIVATSALELGIDWGAIDCVLQIGAPRGISRLVQRIGRANHQFDKASLAYLVPTNCFDTLECQAAIDAIACGTLDGDHHSEGSLDVVVQFIINCACSAPIEPLSLYQLIKSAYPYRGLEEHTFIQLFEFALNGGYVLKHYEEYHRLVAHETGYSIASDKIARRHRQNSGTIIESAHLSVKVLNARKDKILGQVEESFAQQLSEGDTFVFAGLVLQFIRIHELYVEVRKFRTKAPAPKLPAYLGGTLPLTTNLAQEVKSLINTRSRWHTLPHKTQDWLSLQQLFSKLPGGREGEGEERLLVEHYTYKKHFYLTLYCFEGRRANHTLGMLITKRMETQNLLPLSFTASDYGLAIKSLKPVTSEELATLFSHTIIEEELENWLNQSPLLKRSFRQVAIISGLIERQRAGARKSMKQVTFSTDLIYDVLQKHEPQHVLLQMTRTDASRFLLDLERLRILLQRFVGKIDFIELAQPSPMSVSFLTAFRSELIYGDALHELLAQNENELLAAQLIEEVRLCVEGG